MECQAIDDDIRWLIALISDSGMRLSEAVIMRIGHPAGYGNSIYKTNRF